jgi:hypothetical protein
LRPREPDALKSTTTSQRDPEPALDQPSPSRRKFLAATANLASAAWIAANWPQIAAAADHSAHGMADTTAQPTTIKTLTAAEAAEVDAIMNQIVPGGASPGARDAHVLYFIDNALGSFFAEQLPAFRQGLAEFGSAYAAKNGGGKFSAASEAQQIAWLHEVDETPFFAAVRRLTVLGLISWPKYGGNFDNLGWKLLKVEDNHSWSAPFGYYDTDYAGFVPFPGTKPYTVQGPV